MVTTRAAAAAKNEIDEEIENGVAPKHNKCSNKKHDIDIDPQRLPIRCKAEYANELRRWLVSNPNRNESLWMQLNRLEQDIEYAIHALKKNKTKLTREMEKDLDWCKEVGSNPKETSYCGKYDYLEMCVLHNYHHMMKVIDLELSVLGNLQEK